MFGLQAGVPDSLFLRGQGEPCSSPGGSALGSTVRQRWVLPWVPGGAVTTGLPGPYPFLHVHLSTTSGPEAALGLHDPVRFLILLPLSLLGPFWLFSPN